MFIYNLSLLQHLTDDLAFENNTQQTSVTVSSYPGKNFYWWCGHCYFSIIQLGVEIWNLWKNTFCYESLIYPFFKHKKVWYFVELMRLHQALMLKPFSHFYLIVYLHPIKDNSSITLLFRIYMEFRFREQNVVHRLLILRKYAYCPLQEFRWRRWWVM